MKKPPVSLSAEVLAGLQDRLIDHIVIVDAGHSSPCWESTYAIQQGTGYSRMYANNKPRRVHRVAYELWVGPIPVDKVIDHLCRNLICCNPEHLEAVTQRENTRRGTSHIAEQMRQTHCIHGHEFTPENTRRRDGRRFCKECDRQRWIATGRRPVIRALGTTRKTHCMNGHERTEENTYITPKGTRACRICNLAAVRRYKERKAAA